MKASSLLASALSLSFGLSGCAMRASVVPPESQFVAAADAGSDVIKLKGPIGLAESPHGELYVGNSATSQILVYDKENRQLTSRTISDHIKNPAGLAFDRKGDLYVANATSHELTVYDPSGKFVRAFRTGSRKLFPSGVQIDPKGHVWVAARDSSDYSVGEVEIYKSSGKRIKSIRANLEYPLGIVFVDRQAWVCDSTTPSGNALSVFDLNGAFVKKVFTPNFTPTYAAYNGKGRLYVTNGLAPEIAVVDASGTVARITMNRRLDYPYGIAFTKSGEFYVANVGNSTITEYKKDGKLLHVIR